MNLADKNIINYIKKKKQEEETYWDFKNLNSKDSIYYAHSYPAKMVPDMQAELINIVLQNDSSIKNIFDPYMGSGTILIEGLCRNLDTIGIDINPLAYLMTLVRTTKISISLLRVKSDKLLNLINNTRNVKDFKFDGINKWFNDDIIHQLSRIRYCIMQENDILYRRVFWLAFTEIVRLANNSQKSTFKLHIKKQNIIESFQYDCIKNFSKQLEKDINSFDNLYRAFNIKNKTRVYLGDTIKVMSDKRKFRDCSVDLIVTSPPYGDNHTTVTYGQFSILPLRWIDINDIKSNMDNSILKTLTEIDKESLGGTNYSIDVIYNSNILKKSKTLSSTFDALVKAGEKNKARKVASFYIDFYNSCVELSRVLKKDKYAIFTIGNRRVNGEVVRFDLILSELLSTLKLKRIYDFDRNIPSKRIASKISRLKNNKPVYSIQTETTLIFRKR